MAARGTPVPSPLRVNMPGDTLAKITCEVAEPYCNSGEGGDGRPYAHSSLLTTCQRGFVECAEEPSIRAPLAIVKQDHGDIAFSLNDAVDSVANCIDNAPALTITHRARSSSCRSVSDY